MVVGELDVWRHEILDGELKGLEIQIVLNRERSRIGVGGPESKKR